MKQLNYLLFLLVCLVTSIPSFAQFTINGRSVIYDKVSDTYMVSILKMLSEQTMKLALH